MDYQGLYLTFSSKLLLTLSLSLYSVFSFSKSFLNRICDKMVSSRLVSSRLISSDLILCMHASAVRLVWSGLVWSGLDFTYFTLLDVHDRLDG